MYSANEKSIINKQSPVSTWKPFEIINVDGKKTFRASDIPKKISTEINCIDWYLVTRIYINGVLQETVEEYMYTTCGDDQYLMPTNLDPDPDSYFDYNDNININFGEADDEGISIVPEVASTGEKKYVVSWYPYKAEGGTLKFKSFERIKLLGLLGNWTVDDVSHISLNPEGVVNGQNVEAVLNYSDDISTEYWAKMKLSFKDKRTYMKRGVSQVSISDDVVAQRAWGVPELLAKD